MVQKSLDTLSFEDSLSELEKIVASLESGRAPLDESIAAYERGIDLKNHCEKKLREARSRIEKITLADNGTVQAEPIKLD